MKQINIDQVFDLIYNHSLIPCGKVWLINQDNGKCVPLVARDVFRKLNQIRDPVFRTDDDGMLRIVTLDIYYNYQKEDLYTGSLIRVIFRREEKRIQSHLNSDGVGAPRINHDCILPFTNN